MSLRVAAASSLADHALGGLGMAGAILAADYTGLLDLGSLEPVIHALAGGSLVLWVGLAAYIWVKQGGRGRLDRRRPAGSHGSLSAEQWDKALLESETLRRHVAGVALDEEILEDALDESPTFAAEYLEEEARSL